MRRLRHNGFVVVLGLLLVLLTGHALAAEGTKTSAEQLSLQEAVSMALTSHPSVLKAEMSLKEAEINWQNLEAAGRFVVAEKELESAAEALEAARRGVQQARESIALKVQQLFHEVQRACDVAEERASALEISKKRLEIAEAKYSGGLISDLDIVDSRNAVESAKAALAAAERSVALAYMQFNREVGLDLQARPQLEGQFAYVPFAQSLEECIQVALENRLDVEAARRAVDDAAEALAMAQNEGRAEAEIEKARMDLRRAELDREQKLIDVRIEIHSAYNSLVAAEGNIELKQMSLERERRALQIQKARYERGLLSDLEVAEKERSVDMAASAVRQAIYDYNMAVAELRRAMGVAYGTTILTETAE